MARYSCLSRSNPEIHLACCWDIEQPENNFGLVSNNLGLVSKNHPLECPTVRDVSAHALLCKHVVLQPVMVMRDHPVELPVEWMLNTSDELLMWTFALGAVCLDECKNPVLNNVMKSK